MNGLDPERITIEACWQALCPVCGWHTPPISPKRAVLEMVARHLAGPCPVLPAD